MDSEFKLFILIFFYFQISSRVGNKQQLTANSSEMERSYPPFQ